VEGASNRSPPPVEARPPRVERLGVFDDFFALGGTSLQAMALVGDLQPIFGDGVTLTLLFDAPTIADLAGALVALAGREATV
jgi:Phosphopantetheine attachment site